jgi:predicted DNA-binding transcriptional regulator AlpA
MPEKDLMVAKECSDMVGLTEKALSNMRSRGEGPPYIRVSRSAIRYSRKAVAAWLAERTVTPGSAA